MDGIVAVTFQTHFGEVWLRNPTRF